MTVFSIDHSNYNVFDLQKSIAFYRDALGFTELRRKEAADGSFILVYVGPKNSGHAVELTWLRDRESPYNLGDNEIHLAVYAEDYEAAYKCHQEMGCICYENREMGLYFISDPDGYWIEIMPKKKSVKEGEAR